jgi:hypothetical protein
MNFAQGTGWAGYIPALLVCVLFAIACVLAFDIRHSTEAFEKNYREYAIAGATADAAAYAPGAGNNPARVELNNALIQILGNTKISTAERLSRAKRGLEVVQILDHEADAITERLQETEQTLVSMEDSADLISNFFSKGLPGKIISLAHARREAINDVRAYTYRANSETRKILEHIVQENGTLSSAYVQELNNLIPQTEEAFNQRTNRYADLQRITSDMDQLFLEFVQRFSRPKS